MQDIELKEIEYGSKEYKDELELRNKVLRIPLGLDIYDEDLKGENGDAHIGAFYNGKLVGVTVLTGETEKTVRMRQVAVLDTLRGCGVGKMLVEYAERMSLLKGYKEVMLHSRMTSKDFYIKLGYTVTSDMFYEVMIPHVEMKKQLN